MSASRELAEQGTLRSFWERLDRTRAAFASAVAQHRMVGDVADPRRVLAGGGGRGSRPIGATEHTEGPGVRLVDDLFDHVVDDAVDRLSGGPGGEGGNASGSSPEWPLIGDGRRVLVPLDQLVDLAPISGPEAFEKLPLQKMYRGLRLLEERVLPAVRRGLGREQIREMDEQAGTAGSPNGLLTVYDAFFGGEEHAVVVNRRPDGRFSVEAGRHRFWAAQRLLLEALPVVIR